MKHLSLISILCSFALAALLSGCQRNRVLTIGVSQCSNDDWRCKMNDEMERELMFHPDVRLDIRSAEDNKAKQIADLRDFAARGYDMILVAPLEAEALTPVVDSIYRSGKPVLVFDRDISGHGYTAWRGADDYAIGRDAALYAAHFPLAHCNVLEIRGLDGSTPSARRRQGFHDACDSMAAVRIVGEASGEWYEHRGAQVADSLLRLHPEANVIYAHNDRMAIGAAAAARKLGREVRVIGIDAAPSIGLRAVRDSLIDATFLYPTNGEQVIKTALDILAGKRVAKVEKYPTSPAVDLTNVEFLIQEDQALREKALRLRELGTKVDYYVSLHTSQQRFLLALIASVLLMLVVMALILKQYWLNRTYQDTLEQKGREIEEATQAKLRFFTNVSHDLRTPLTLISAPVNELTSADNLTPRQHSLATLAANNVKILMRLINDLLDFRKYESGKLTPHPAEADPASLLPMWVNSFATYAKSRGISLTCSVDVQSAVKTLALDIESTERVVYNLVSNALRHTPEGGSIEVRATLDSERLILSVADTGEGIAQADLPDIFRRFYQADRVCPQGSGLGLALVKAFVEMQNGTVEVDSTLDEGSTFTISLPVTHVATNVSDGYGAAKVTQPELQPVEGPTAIETTTDDSLPMLLAIDDNRDLHTLLDNLLAAEYRIIHAYGGRKGIEMSRTEVPDVIVCDVMMPDLDGMETCNRIKTTTATSHIPVLMLTACAQDEQRVQGYDSGADGYLTKPFNTTVLRARLKSLIDNRRRISPHAAMPVAETAEASTATPKAEVDTPTDKESLFYQRFAAIVSKRMADESLDVDTIAGELNLGRSQLYRKLKALTGSSPIELVLRLRLDKAQQLLRTTDMSVSEIAYAVGFASPAYFSKRFRMDMGATPSDYREGSHQ